VRESKDNAGKSGKPTTSRRRFVKTGLAIGAGSALFSSGSINAAASDYDTVTVSAGDVHSVVVDGDQTLENKLYDVTADGAGVTFRLKDNATVRNIGIKGKNQPDRFVFRMGSGTNNITIDRVYTECYDPEQEGPGGIVATANATGTLNIKGASIHGWGNNGLYASKADMDIYAEDCYFVNNRTSNYRAGGNYHGNNRDAVFRNCVTVVDSGMENVPLYPGGGHRTAGFLARWGEIELYNCHAWFKDSAPLRDNWYVLRTDNDRGSPQVDVSDSEINPRDLISGNINYVENVGSDPTDMAPDYAPVSAEDAASGTTADSTTTTVAVSTDSATDVAETSASLNGELTTLNGADSAEALFEYRQSGASSWTTTASQTLSSTGSFSQTVDSLSTDAEYEFRAVVTVDGDTADTGSANTFSTGLANSLKIDGSDIGHEVTYEITVSDEIVNGDLANDNDSIEGSTAVGQVNGGIDTYEFAGEITEIQVSEELPIYVNGTQIDISAFDSSPSIDRYEVTEAGSKNPHANITTEWDVSDTDGNLSSVTVDVIDASGTIVDSATSSISGEVAYDVDYFELRHVDGETFTVRVTVTDTAGNEASTSETVQE